MSSSSHGVSFSSADPAVIKAADDYEAAVNSMLAKRKAVGERYGRRLMVNRNGFGHAVLARDKAEDGAS